MNPCTMDLPSPASLSALWARFIRHGILMGPLDPQQAEGARVSVRLIPRWGGVSVQLDGTVVQAMPGGTVVRLDGLDDAARAGLAGLGIGEALSAVLPTPAPPSSPSIPAVPPGAMAAGAAHGMSPNTAPTIPAVATLDGTMTMPAGTPAHAAPAPGNPAPNPAAWSNPAQSGAFSPAGMQPGASTGGFRPAIAFQRPAGGGGFPGQFPGPPSGAAFPAVATPAPPTGATAAATSPVPAPAPGASGAPGAAPDLRAIVATAGPGQANTETILPPATDQADLGRVPWRDLLLHFFAKRSTGVLVIHAFREIRWCYLVDGKPVHYAGDHPHPGEFLSDALLAASAIQADDWASACRMQRIAGILPGEWLVAAGRLPRERLNEALRQRAARITQNLLGMNFGSARFHPLEEIRKAFPWPPIDVLALLMQAQREALSKVDDDKLIEQATPFYKMHARIVAGRRELIPQLPMNETERKVAYEIIPAGWTLGEIVALKEMEERQLVRLVLALRAMGIVEFVADEGEASKRNRAERILYGAMRDLTRRDVFGALHAHWSSSTKEVEDGYQKLLKENSRERFAGVLDARVEELIENVHKKAAEIYRLIHSPKGRAEARKDLVSVDQLRMASDLLDKQGEMAAYKGEVALARACYERVLELDPGGPEGAENIARAKAALNDPRMQSAGPLGDKEAGKLADSLDGLL